MQGAEANFLFCQMSLFEHVPIGQAPHPPRVDNTLCAVFAPERASVHVKNIDAKKNDASFHCGVAVHFNPLQAQDSLTVKIAQGAFVCNFTK